MAILNETELRAANELLFQTGVVGNITAAKVREWNVDTIESYQSYRAVISGSAVPSITVTNTGFVWPEFDTNGTVANALLTPDFAGGKVTVSEPGRYFVTLRFFGQWPAGEDLNFEVRVNGIANSITPVSLAQEGQGAADPIALSVTDVEYIVDSAMITAGGGTADVTLFVKSTTGDFDVDQTGASFGIRYEPLSIRTVG